MEKLAVSVTEAARLISVGKSTCYALIEQGRLPAVHIGKRVIIPVAELERWIIEHTQGADNE